MQKTLLKFAVFELIERIARFRLTLREIADDLSLHAPVLHSALLREVDALEGCVMEQRTVLDRLFSDATPNRGELASKPGSTREEAIFTMLQEMAARLSSPTRILARLKELHPEPETMLFLRDAVPASLMAAQVSQEQSVFLVAESEASPFGPISANLSSSGILLDTLPVLQKNNPLGWMGLTFSATTALIGQSSDVAALKQEFLRGSARKKTLKQEKQDDSREALLDELLHHAVNLRLLGPAYYFYAISQAVLAANPGVFLQVMEPALFFGLNHQNFVHKSIVITHEACDRSRFFGSTGEAEPEALVPPWGEEDLPSIYRAIERLVPARLAFSEKNMDRAIQLRERLGQGVLLSASGKYELSEVANQLSQLKASQPESPSVVPDTPVLSIYEPLAMMTEYPHSPREIVNAGWLHKMDRAPIWLYSVLNEQSEFGFDRLVSLLNEQDSLLRKSIEVGEVHRVLLCSL